MSEIQQFPAHFKVADGEKGIVTAVVSVFGNVDAQNDRVMPGAFAHSIETWRKYMSAGRFLPVVYGHKDDPEYVIGKVVDLRETAEGLEVDEQYFLNQPKARTAFNLVREGVLPTSSFAYDIHKARYAKDGVQELQQLHLIEVGPTIYPANAETRLVGVKAVDNSAWDGAAAMAACKTAADYRSVCAGERDAGDPDERQHWALPHHSRPGAPPNAGGVRNALSRLPQTEGLKNKAGAQSHLEAHMRAINPDRAGVEPNGKVDFAPVVEAFADALVAGTKAGRAISARNRARIQASIDAHEAAISDLRALLDEYDTAQEPNSGDGKSDEPDTARDEDQPVKAALRDEFAALIG